MIVKSPLLMALAMICLVATPTRAELSLGQLRVKFETAVESEDSELGEKSQKLREGYGGALEKLKVNLGREEKLEQATQVLAELEILGGGGEMNELPENVDYRLKALRTKWRRAQKKLGDGHQDKIAGLAKTYLKVLEERKRTLTRGGKIREALVVEEEAKRVGEIEVVAKALVKTPGIGAFRGSYGEGNLAHRKTGAKAFAPYNPDRLIDGIVDDYEDSGRFAFGLKNSCELSVKLRKLYVVSKVKLLLYDIDVRSYRYRLEVSADGEAWQVVDDRAKRGGKAGWREIDFEPQDVRYIRVKGFGNTVNDGLHIVELEAYSPER